MPVGLRGLFMAVLLAALMSTISAMINVTSSVVINDFVKRYFAKNLTQKQLVRLGQIASVAAVLVGFVFSCPSPTSSRPGRPWSSSSSR